MSDVKVNVTFTQAGEWGGVTFKAELFYQEDEFAILTSPDSTPNLYPALRIIDGPEQYIGLLVHPGEIIPGLFAEGYNNPLSGKCYKGSLKVGDGAADLRHFGPPSAIFPAPPSYLHVDDGDKLTAEQRALLLDAIRYDRKDRFMGGQSAVALFSREELEGEKRGQIYYT